LASCYTYIFFSGLTFGDIFFDSLLTVEYYHQYNNESFVASAKVISTFDILTLKNNDDN